MSSARSTRWATLAWLAALLGCSGDPPAAVGGNGGAAGSMTAPVAGTAGVAAGGSSTGGNSNPSAGTAGSGIAGGGVAGLGGSSGAGGSAAGTGGGAGGTGGGAAGTGGSSAGAGGTDPEGWVTIFNGQDLTGWKPLIHKSGTYDNDPLKTFRVDPATHVIRVTYVDYPKIATGNDAGRANFDSRCGLLYYDKPLTNYRVRATYHFVDESIERQAANAVGWGRFNSGLMIFGTDPSKVMGDPMFPPVLEIQLLGNGSSGGSTNPNICNNGGMNYSKADCGNNKSNVPAPAPTTWVTVEAEVHPGGMTKVWTYAPDGKPDLAKPIETVTGVTYNGTPLTAGYMGYISLQSESQPCEFKNVQLIELPN